MHGTFVTFVESVTILRGNASTFFASSCSCTCARVIAGQAKWFNVNIASLVTQLLYTSPWVWKQISVTLYEIMGPRVT